MPTLFIYYSLTGNGDLVAEKMRELGAEVCKVQTAKPMPKSFFGAILKGGFLAAIGHKMPLKDFDLTLDGYDRVVIGSPVWNGRLACPINTVLASLDLAGKEVAFVLCAGGGEAPKAVARLKKEYPSASVVILKEPKKYADELAKISNYFDKN